MMDADTKIQAAHRKAERVPLHSPVNSPAGT